MSTWNPLPGNVLPTFGMRVHDRIREFHMEHSNDDDFDEARSNFLVEQLNVVLVHVDKLEQRLQDSHATLRQSQAAAERRSLIERRDAHRIRELEEQIEFMRRDRFYHDHLHHIEAWQHIFFSRITSVASATELSYSQARQRQLEAMQRQWEDAITTNSEVWTARQLELLRQRQLAEAQVAASEGSQAVPNLRQHQNQWAASGIETRLPGERIWEDEDAVPEDHENESNAAEVETEQLEQSPDHENNVQDWYAGQRAETSASPTAATVERAFSEMGVADAENMPPGWNFEIHADSDESPDDAQDDAQVPDAETFHINEDPDLDQESQEASNAATVQFFEDADNREQSSGQERVSPHTARQTNESSRPSPRPNRRQHRQASTTSSISLHERAMTLHREIAQHNHSVRTPLGTIYDEDNEETVIADMEEQLEMARVRAQTEAEEKAKAEAETEAEVEAQTKTCKKRKFESEEETRTREHLVEISKQLDTASEERPAKRRKLEHTRDVEEEEW